MEDPLLLHRIQFGFTVAYHHLFPFSRKGDDTRASHASSWFIGGMLGATAFGLYRDLLPASTDASTSLTVANSLAHEYSLGVGLFWWTIGIILAIGHRLRLPVASREGDKPGGWRRIPGWKEETWRMGDCFCERCAAAGMGDARARKGEEARPLQRGGESIAQPLSVGTTKNRHTLSRPGRTGGIAPYTNTPSQWKTDHEDRDAVRCAHRHGSRRERSTLSVA